MLIFHTEIYVIKNLKARMLQPSTSPSRIAQRFWSTGGKIKRWSEIVLQIYSTQKFVYLKKNKTKTRNAPLHPQTHQNFLKVLQKRGEKQRHGLK